MGEHQYAAAYRNGYGDALADMNAHRARRAAIRAATLAIFSAAVALAAFAVGRASMAGACGLGWDAGADDTTSKAAR